MASPIHRLRARRLCLLASAVIGAAAAGCPALAATPAPISATETSASATAPSDTQPQSPQTSRQRLGPTSPVVRTPDWRNHLFAALGGQATNLVIWLPSRYLFNSDFAYISTTSIRRNLSTSVAFDDDRFLTNQFGHPYQGGLYHAFARAQGLSFTTSALYVLLGNVTWELLMESELPSINDLITTQVGGIAWGEVTWRLASRVLDNNATGAERFARELTALVIQPGLGLTRLVTGRAFASGPAPRMNDLSVRLQAGTVGVRRDDGLRGVGLNARLEAKQGHVEKLPANFGAFEIYEAQLGVVFTGPAQQPLRRADLHISGLLGGARLSRNGRQYGVFGAFIDFDFFASNVLDLGTSGVGPGLALTLSPSSKWRFDVETMMLVHFGGVTAEYTSIANRNYDFGVGLAAKVDMRLTRVGLGELFLRANRYEFKIVSGRSGRQFTGLLNGGVRVDLSRRVQLSVSFGLIDSHARNDGLPAVDALQRGGELLLGWHM